MFDSKGAEMDIAIELLLQMIIREAKCTKLALLLSASQFNSDTVKLLSIVKERLSYMFLEPEKSILVCITKLKFNMNTFSRKDLYKIAKDENQKCHTSFNGYQICLVEEDEVHSMKALIQ